MPEDDDSDDGEIFLPELMSQQMLNVIRASCEHVLARPQRRLPERTSFDLSHLEES